MEKNDDIKLVQENIQDDTPHSDDGKRDIPGMFDGPIRPLIIKLAIPIAAGMLVQMVYTVVDAIFISLIDKSDPSYFGATGIVFPIIFMASAIMSGLMIGTSSMVARAIGSGNNDVLDKTAESGMVIALSLSLIILIVGYSLDERLVTLLGAKGDYAVHGLEYLRYILPGVMVMFVGHIFFGVLQGEGLMKFFMWAMIIGTVGNIILDPIFIFLLDMKVRGAALATVIAQTGAVIYVLFLFIRKKTRVPIHWKLANIEWKVMKEIVAIGFPQAVSMIMMSLTIVVYNRTIISIDELALTAFALYGRFEQMLFIPIFSIGSALVTIVGQNSGRGNIDRCRETWRKSLGMGIIAVVVLAGVFVLISPFIYSSLSDIPAVVDYAVRGTQVLAFSLLFAVIGIFARNIFQGIGSPLPALFLTFLRLVIFNIPTILLLVYVFDWGVYGVWVGIVIGNGLSAIVSFSMITRLFRKLKDGTKKVRSV